MSDEFTTLSVSPLSRSLPFTDVHFADEFDKWANRQGTNRNILRTNIPE